MLVSPDLRDNFAFVRTRTRRAINYRGRQHMYLGVRGPSHVEKSLIAQGHALDTLHQRAGLINNRVRHVGFESVVDVTVLLSAADQRGEIFGIRAAQSIMDADNATAAFDE